ncbi:substrate-binding and VWA domain-containing protein [Nocardioides sp. AE5]|uniref:substrate-binding and VWA domain-containing protein n=1 Tax=Nocardioides sp. AE5 TaxID=2962573 RepID=UPI002881829E|nr:substrate-binding and VWA domain-containing protein [Nocardioides sp. AE5]MDT0201956.1 substrate-binding and VWA domain-containing protein [Nocardioides sp. AE5]
MSTGHHARERDTTLRGRIVIGLIVLALLLAALFVWRARTSPAADGCASPPTATVVSAPDLAPALTATVAAMRAEGWCAAITVEARQSSEVFADLATGAGQGSGDLWVPDSDVWLDQLAADGVRPQVLIPSLASTPVVLAGGPSAKAPESWSAALAAASLVLRDPQQEAASALALAAPRAEQETSGVSSEEISARLVPVAQRYGARSDSEPTPIEELLASVTTTTKVLVPVTEQAYLAARPGNRRLVAVVPDTGTLTLTYPLVALDPAAQENRAVQALLDYLGRPQGSAALADHGFRAAGGAPLDGIGVGEVEVLTRPEPAEMAADLRMWDVLTVPSSILAVIDASGSMDFRVPGAGTRMELATSAAATALETFPDQARVGLWLFSIDQGGPGIDHRELVPLRRLDDEVEGSTQREVLAPWLVEALDLTNGGTGLYDTALAAYRSAQESYDPAYFNAVVLLTDGANEDPGSIELDKLLATLRAERDPERPVRIIAIGISEDADMDALTQIAEATGGSAYAALDPRDILDVISKALLAR